VAADVLTLLAFGSALLLSVIDHQRSVRPSTLLALYLSVFTLLQIPRLRTAWLIRPGGNVAASSIAVLVFTFAALVFESKAPGKTTSREKTTPEQSSGFWIRTVFAWLLETFRTGYAKVISVDDLPALDVKLRSRDLHRTLSLNWAKCKLSFRYMRMVCY
jgi:ATP-binding cassette subfamily C (CFTR/MRP) protein 1